MVPMVAMSFLFTSESMPPIETISAYAAGSLLPSNNIGTEDFSITITNFSGLPMIVETAVVTSEKTGLVSTPSKLRLVMMCRQGMFLLLISKAEIKMGRFTL
ncbi:hypothetical protein V8G54_021098 [Vigna mungo]|uniref:Uncharacterized protein n=1 Tax=Vigna mungo TaxID=3915 RepID=A0AAQ3NDQ3_VIGMU